MRTLALGVASCTLVAGCGDLDKDQSASAGTKAASTTAAELDSEHARVVVDRLRSRFSVQQRASSPAARPGVPGTPTVPSSSVRQPLIGPSSSGSFVRADQRLQVKWGVESAVDVWVPVRSTDAFGVRDRATEMAIQSKLTGARDSAAAVVGGLAVYEGAGPTGGTVVHRLTEAGTEDYVTFETQPANGELSYEVSISKVAGLRLVGNSLEFVDAAGDPRIRISAPFVVGAQGEVVEAELSVAGCAVDSDPSAPWDRAPVPPGNDRCQVAVRWDAAAVTYPAIVDPSWSSTANMATGRSWFIGAAISTNRVLVSGGYSPTFAALSSAELYNPSTRTWAATGSMASMRVFHEAAVRGGGRVLVAGGSNGSTTLASAESYNPATGTWTTHSAMNKPRSSHRLTTLNNGDVLVSGGNGNGTTDAQRFSDVNATWSNAGNMLSALAQHTATLLTDGRVLVVGDQAPFGQLFQPSNNTWSATANAPEQRISHVAVRLSSGNVLVAGGATPSFDGMGAELFNPSTGLWSRTGSLWQPHISGASATLLSDGRMLLVGGGGGNSRTASEIYDSTWGTWRPGPALTPSRQHAIIARLQNDRVLLAGGVVDGFTPVASATEFIPTTTATTNVSYKLTAAVDSEVMPTVTTEVWATVYRPSTLPAGRMPVLVFLHGNHGTCGTGSNPRDDASCEYTTTGTCPTGSVISPNQRGYEYIGRELASRGYFVASINANRGITCGSSQAGDDGLILARGRLVLKHLQRLSEWNRGVAATPASLGVNLNGKLDLTQVGLMGHSRGGEGVRAAYNLYRASGSPWPGRIVDPVTFRGIFEIAPTEWRGSENAVATNRAVLLPMCDGDVRWLDGVQAFDRMMALSETTSTARPKSTYTVWGANHNYYNTEWQISESAAFCFNHDPMFTSGPGVTGSAEQRQSGFQAMLAFFVANVGNGNAPVDSWFNNYFNPEFATPFRPNVDRGYTPGLGSSSSLMLEDFINGAGTSSYGLSNTHSGVTVVHDSVPEHAPALRAGQIAWSSSGAFFQTNFAASGSGFNLTSYQMLDLRVERRPDNTKNVAPDTKFSVQLVNSNNSLSNAVAVHNWGPYLTGPVGGPDGPHAMLQTARIPLSAFTGATLSSVRGVRLVFSTTPSGHIYVANVRATRSTVVSGAGALVAGAQDASGRSLAAPSRTRSGVTSGMGTPPPTQRITGNRILGIRATPDGSSVEIEVGSTTKFRPRDAMLVMLIGDTKVTSSGYSNPDLTRVTFTLERKAFDAAVNGAPMRVRYEPGSDVEWDFGAFDKSRLSP